MSLLLVVAAAAVVVLLATVCAVRSNRLLDEGDDERPPLWLVPARDPARERREAYPCRAPAFASQREAHVWSETRLAQTRESHSVYTCVEGHWHVGRER